MSFSDSTFDQAFKNHQNGDMAQAETLYQQVIRADATNVSAWNNLGNVLKDQGRIGEAMECYRRAIRINVDYPNAYYNLGNIFQDQGRFAEAIQCYRQALRNSSHVEIYYNL